MVGLIAACGASQPHTSDETARAAEVLDRLSAVTDDFLFATWTLE